MTASAGSTTAAPATGDGRRGARPHGVTTALVLAGLLLAAACGDRSGDGSDDAATKEPGASAGLTWDHDGLAGYAFGDLRDEVVERLTEELGEPERVFEQGTLCGPATGWVHQWGAPTEMWVGFDLDDRLGEVSFNLDAVPHADGEVGEGTLYEDLVAVEPGVDWGGPYTAPGDGSPDYFEWTIEGDDVAVTGGLTGPPPDGRVEGYVRFATELAPMACGE